LIFESSLLGARSFSLYGKHPFSSRVAVVGHSISEWPIIPHEKQKKGSLSYTTSYHSFLCLLDEKTETPRGKGSFKEINTLALKSFPRALF